MSRVYDSASVVSEERVFLAHLPSGTSIYCYNQQRAITSLFSPYSVEDSFVVLKHFPADTLADYEEQLPGRCDYSPSLQILIITMPSQPHEEAASSFETLITILAREMNVSRRIANCGATLVHTPERSKQADRSWKPARQGREFPTVALEVGYSKTTTKLERDIAWWINGSKGGVKMGVIIDIKSSHSIDIKCWTPAFEASLHNIYITARGRPVIHRHINNSPLPPSYDPENPHQKGEKWLQPFD